MGLGSCPACPIAHRCRPRQCSLTGAISSVVAWSTAWSLSVYKDNLCRETHWYGCRGRIPFTFFFFNMKINVGRWGDTIIEYFCHYWLCTTYHHWWPCNMILGPGGRCCDRSVPIPSGIDYYPAASQSIRYSVSCWSCWCNSRVRTAWCVLVICQADYIIKLLTQKHELCHTIFHCDILPTFGCVTLFSLNQHSFTKFT